MRKISTNDIALLKINFTHIIFDHVNSYKFLRDILRSYNYGNITLHGPIQK